MEGLYAPANSDGQLRKGVATGPRSHFWRLERFSFESISGLRLPSQSSLPSKVRSGELRALVVAPAKFHFLEFMQLRCSVRARSELFPTEKRYRNFSRLYFDYEVCLWGHSGRSRSCLSPGRICTCHCADSLSGV